MPVHYSRDGHTSTSSGTFVKPRTRRLALKPDSSFFRKIVIGVVGARAVADDLAKHGHRAVELERGSTETKLWKDVKRKRVRIPDLICLNCGVRVESRAKTKAELSMSHSPSDAERAWDYGMVNQDYIALPVCEEVDESYWSVGDLSADLSYWHERNWVRWRPKPYVNYFAVKTFRSAAYSEKGTKGATEGSETSIVWEGTFSTRVGRVDAVNGHKVTVQREPDGHRYTWRIGEGMKIFVRPGDQVQENQLIAGDVQPLRSTELACTKALPKDHIRALLRSRERTLRFTGVKLARLLRDGHFRDAVAELARDGDEDIYVRLEACSYLSSVCDLSARRLFGEHVGCPDPQSQLEAVISLGETRTAEAVELLCAILDDAGRPFFLRSAAAWALSQTRDTRAISRLVRAFSDVDNDIREEALQGLVAIGGPAIQVLLEALKDRDNEIAAGSAEALRQLDPIPEEAVLRVAEEVRTRNPARWAVWLLGNLPRQRVAPAIASLQETDPEIHYAIALLWSFLESWIARRWELKPRASHGMP